MDKDAYVKRCTREKLVQTFLGKLDMTQIKDADIVVALNRYVETGDEAFFTEFTKWNEAKDKEQQLQKKKNNLKADESWLKEWEQELSDYKKRLESEYKELYTQFEKYRGEIADFYKNDYYPHGEWAGGPTVKGFIQLLKEKGENSQAGVWVVVGSEMYRAEGLVIDDKNRVVVSLNEQTKINITAPPRFMSGNIFYKGW